MNKKCVVLFFGALSSVTIFLTEAHDFIGSECADYDEECDAALDTEKKRFFFFNDDGITATPPIIDGALAVFTDEDTIRHSHATSPIYVDGSNNVTEINDLTLTNTGQLTLPAAHGTLPPGSDVWWMVIDEDGLVGSVQFGPVGSFISAKRYKTDIEPIENSSDTVGQIGKLVPVSFRFLKEHDSQQRVQYGLIAEDVAEIDPVLVIYNKEGEPEGVNYQMLSILLLSKVQELEARLGSLEGRINE